jgi:hypothetical protein
VYWFSATTISSFNWFYQLTIKYQKQNHRRVCGTTSIEKNTHYTLEYFCYNVNLYGHGRIWTKIMNSLNSIVIIYFNWEFVDWFENHIHENLNHKQRVEIENKMQICCCKFEAMESGVKRYRFKLSGLCGDCGWTLCCGLVQPFFG